MTYLKPSFKPELKPSDLKWNCDPETFQFDSTDTLAPMDGIIGQERALKALKIGIDLRSPGYNIYITGLSGTGKASTVKKILETISPIPKELNDYMYVNNFENPDYPTVIMLRAGDGVKFRKEMSEAIKFLQERIPQVLESEPFLGEKKKMLTEYGQFQQKLLQEFEKKLNEDNFSLGQVKMGEITRPEIVAVIGGQPFFITQLDELIGQGKITDQEAKEMAKKYAGYQEELQALFKKGIKLSQQFQQKISELETNSVKLIVDASLSGVADKFQSEKMLKYLNQVRESILTNLTIFKEDKTKEERTETGFVIDYFKEYEVNVILDNSNLSESPVILETTPSHSNLFGTIEKFSDGRGGWYADFTKIKAGSLLRANGGYIVINALDAFSEPGVWKTLKRVLLYGKLEIQDFLTQYQFTPSILKPEPIEIDTKVIFIGGQQLYSILSAYEEDFNKLFKIKADFDYEMDMNEKSLIEYARVIKKLIEAEKLLPFDKSAIERISEYGVRYAGRRYKITTRFAVVADIVREASYWAKDSGATVVSNYHVDQAYKLSRERHGLYESKLSELINRGILLIDTKSERVGQINGLAVYGTNFYSFGKPARITASVSLGNGNIINVEREAGLSGNTHNKGVLIISGYFREKFGQKFPLSFTASLVFEQGYSMIDGDSASAAEICALLSCFSGLPLKQSLAITGSVNQKGDMQPIGGVNEKIEGFFDVCNSRGLSGNEGVIIPEQNINDLMLKDEIIKEVKKGNFHIYSVDKIEQAIELLTGVKAGNLTAKGTYEKNTVFGLVEKKLKEMKELSKQSKGKSPDSKTRSSTGKKRKQ